MGVDSKEFSREDFAGNRVFTVNVGGEKGGKIQHPSAALRVNSDAEAAEGSPGGAG